MSEVTRVHIQGLAELQTALRQLPDTTAKNVLRRVGKQALQPIADRAESLAPKLAGQLKRSITVGTKLSKRQRSMHRAQGSDVEIFAGAGPLPQAHLQEFGTSEFPAQPFMRPAWDAGKDKLLTDIKDLLWIEIQKATARAARKAAKAAKAGD